jgi:hypothetical protein
MLAGQAEPPPERNPSCVAAEEERATLGSGGARKYGCDQTGCGGLSVVEQPASLIGALNSPHDKSVDKRQGLERSLFRAEPSVRIQPPPAESHKRTFAADSFNRTRKWRLPHRRRASVLPDLLHGKETRVWGDQAYHGQRGSLSGLIREFSGLGLTGSQERSASKLRGVAPRAATI